LPPLDDDDDDKDDVFYTYTSVPDAKLFADSDVISPLVLANGLRIIRQGATRIRSALLFALRTGSAICTVAEGALSPIRKTKIQKIANQTTDKERSTNKNVSSNGIVG
jgi:hypothetical protein